ncbi:MAG: prepilin-type N-terminal cleavage/methylation domain-containing protein [Deltaproteobacteria bacterium]|jgi:prepilin-type N-terminal cleavage/methylation domain-containing protein|nr:prepilin-type N-terminal cleavage/methylation domain-containing protein [Deltaproteobacteria bacterium]
MRSSQITHKNGFTLIEVLVCVVLISIGCFAAFNAQFSALKTKTVSDNVMVAAILANSELERLKTLSQNEISRLKDTVEDNLDRFGLAHPDSESSEALFRREIKLFRESPTAFSYHVEVIVHWRDIGGERSIGRSAILTGSTFS